MSLHIQTTAIAANRCRPAGPPKDNFRKRLRETAINEAIAELRSVEKGPHHRIPRGTMERVLADLRMNGVTVTRDNLYYRMRKVEREPAAAALPLQSIAPPLQSIDVQQTSSQGTISRLSPSENSVWDDAGDIVSKARGRPVGTTIKARVARKKARSACVNDITKGYLQQLEKSKVEKKRTSPGFLTELIHTKWEAYGLNVGTSTDTCQNSMVSSETIRNRANACKDPFANHPGTNSPLAPIEEAICDILIQMGRIRQPLSVTESINLANSLIKGSEIQNSLIEFKKQHYKNSPLEQCGRIDYGWWIGFMRRFEHRLVTKRGERFEANRSDWSKEVYIKQMYDVIYDNMLEARIAIALDDPVYMDQHGNVVDENDPSRLGMQCDIKILYPEYLLFADETGCNTSQKKDGHYGGRKLVGERGTTPKTIASSTDKHFTVLGFTAASGDPVLCVVIFAGDRNTMPGNWTAGIDIQVPPVMDEEGRILLEEVNFGPGKFYPGGPVCIFREKVVPYLPLVSPSGGITSDLLVEILVYMDSLDLFDRRQGGPCPMLILDGHESRLGLQFLEYINSECHKWHVSLGVPYATSYWQVGDSSEQNGMFKMLLGENKRLLTSYKTDHGIPITISYDDVVPLVNKSWDLSFGRKATNSKAIAERGWFPPNRNLLLHKEIRQNVSSHGTSTSTTSNNSPSNENLPQGQSYNLNTTDGIAGRSFQKLLQAHARNGGIERHRQALQDGKTIIDIIEKGKRLSSGIMVANGEHSLNNRSTLAALQHRKQVTERNLKKGAIKLRREKMQRIKEVKMLRNNKPDIALWNTKECGLFIQYKKRKSDKAKPKAIADLRMRCKDISYRASPTCSPHESDDESTDSFPNDISLHETGTGSVHSENDFAMLFLDPPPPIDYSIVEAATTTILDPSIVLVPTPATGKRQVTDCNGIESIVPFERLIEAPGTGTNTSTRLDTDCDGVPVQQAVI